MALVAPATPMNPADPPGRIAEMRCDPPARTTRNPRRGALRPAPAPARRQANNTCRPAQRGTAPTPGEPTIQHPTPNQEWREDALCAQTDPEIFFPEPGANATTARRICATCPVRTGCLRDALAHRDVALGVRGGLTPTQRRALLNEQGRRAA